MIMKVGFIGLGIMGKLMSKNFLKVGYLLVVVDCNLEVIVDVIVVGVEIVFMVKVIVEQCDVIIIMLLNFFYVKEVVLGENGIIEGVKLGMVLIDMSFIVLLVSCEISEALKVKGIDMLDVLVSGGELKVIDGMLLVMVGGDKVIFDKYYDLMKVMVGFVVYIGEIGVGNVIKLVNQVIVVLNIVVMLEVLMLVIKVGVNLDLVYQVICGGLVGSIVLDVKVLMVMDCNFKLGFCIDLYIKDLVNVLDIFYGVGV